MKSRGMDTYPTPTMVHSYTIINGYRESDFLLWDRHKIQESRIKHNSIVNAASLPLTLHLPTLPPMEHYKGRFPSIDLLTPGLKTRYYNEFSHSIG